MKPCVWLYQRHPPWVWWLAVFQWSKNIVLKKYQISYCYVHYQLVINKSVPSKNVKWRCVNGADVKLAYHSLTQKMWKTNLRGNRTETQKCWALNNSGVRKFSGWKYIQNKTSRLSMIFALSNLIIQCCIVFDGATQKCWALNNSWVGKFSGWKYIKNKTSMLSMMLSMIFAFSNLIIQCCIVFDGATQKCWALNNSWVGKFSGWKYIQNKTSMLSIMLSMIFVFSNSVLHCIW